MVFCYDSSRTEQGEKAILDLYSYVFFTLKIIRPLSSGDDGLSLAPRTPGACVTHGGRGIMRKLHPTAQRGWLNARTCPPVSVDYNI